MLTNLINVVIMILGFGMLIFVHELGHFLAAKWAGIRTEAFAIGMGPVIAAWRKGIGFKLGSTLPEYRRRALESMGDQLATREKGTVTQSEIAAQADAIGLGETEYSLRWLPIGGFVKMLGQDDADPTAVSNDPRSYTQRPIGKRMVVVSAGVIMNIILAVILYIVAFMAGVQFNAPVIGPVAPGLPAARADGGGLQPGDRLISINGDPTETFADLQIAGAMSKRGEPIEIVIAREGESSPRTFSVIAEHNAATGLLGIGVGPASTTTLRDGPVGQMDTYLEQFNLKQQGVEPGMTLTRVNDQPVMYHHDIDAALAAAPSSTVTTVWRSPGESSEPVTAELTVAPQLGKLATTEYADEGLLGLVPLRKIESFPVGSDRNRDVFEPGDVLLRVGSVSGPRFDQIAAALEEVGSGDVPVTVLRNGGQMEVVASVRKGKLGVHLVQALDVPYAAEPMAAVADPDDPEATVATPAAALNLGGLGPIRLTSINGTPVEDWRTIRAALREVEVADGGASAEVQITYVPSVPDAQPVTQALSVPADELAAIRALTWSAPLDQSLFVEAYTIREAGGNPLTAIRMGAEETWNMIVLTYLTIDRLIRRSVGVKQLRGPVGIVHLGTQILDKGFMYLIFLLAAISVNLAVINFLPLPIVDGGLFLFLLYEKFRGKPPSIAFQNAAALVGICLIVTVLLVVTWNDVMRLLS